MRRARQRTADPRPTTRAPARRWSPRRSPWRPLHRRARVRLQWRGDLSRWAP